MEIEYDGKNCQKKKASRNSEICPYKFRMEKKNEERKWYKHMCGQHRENHTAAAITLTFQHELNEKKKKKRKIHFKDNNFALASISINKI